VAFELLPDVTLPTDAPEELLEVSMVMAIGGVLDPPPLLVPNTNTVAWPPAPPWALFVLAGLKLLVGLAVLVLVPVTVPV
jgi:hypothetical protein